MYEKCLWCFVIICLPITHCNEDDIFNFDADKMLDELMVDSEKVRESQLKLLGNITESGTIATNLSSTKTEQYITVSTQAPPPAATKNIPQHRVKKEDIDKRMKEIEMNALLDRSDDELSLNFSDDVIVSTTRRFDAIKKNARENRKYNQNKQGLREIYEEWQNIGEFQKEKQKLFALIEQFVYVTRYKLTYMQALRKKYMNDVKYKIGFCFALIRDMKNQQMVLFNLMEAALKQKDEWKFHYIYLKMYERIMRLDQDIKDVIKYIKQMEYQRKLKEFPDYYFFFSSSRGTVWRRKK